MGLRQQPTPVQHLHKMADLTPFDLWFIRSVSEQANAMDNSSDGHLESPPSQNGEYEVLTSDCEDTETEIGFYDDEEELQRAKAARRESKRAWRQMHDECGGDTAYDETDDFEDESGASESESACDEAEGEDVCGSGPCFNFRAVAWFKLRAVTVLDGYMSGVSDSERESVLV
ncbi:unnamed protein product [Phytophthora fragariaefolia]|uniref:Unnamed protein product n=1 Tax=Phytophthora fragariaefolia TaxID=1490495 RepID=A0A9W6YGL2_9STRA|nr:unnamed protein product [Phytophthora fragariaefolia]